MSCLIAGLGLHAVCSLALIILTPEQAFGGVILSQHCCLSYGTELQTWESGSLW